MNLLIVCGSAPCLQEDINKLKSFFTTANQIPCDLMAIGLDAFKQPVPWKYVATGHFEDLPFIKAYAGLHKQKAYKLIHYQRQVGVDIVEPRETWEGGSSALLGVMAAIKLGYTKIVLCGCPMQGANPGHPGADYSMFQSKWEEKKDELLLTVRSMSGFTRVLLGMPTEEWLCL
jgi:hypothetical protein